MSTALIGGIVGPVSARPSGSSNVVDSGQSVDFAIGGLSFNLAVSDDHPYERATADFRKQQFDNAPVPGEQGLDGWWLRSQLSFHKGAGIKYYEVLDGETVLDRYHDSEAVNPWTAGRVSLIPELADLAVEATAAVPGTLGETPGVFCANSTGLTFHDGTTATAVTTSDGGAPTSLTSDGRYFYATNGSLIERQSSVTTQRTNHVTNPNFETNTTGWSGAGAAIARDTTRAAGRTASLKVTLSAGFGYATHSISGLVAGTTYRVSAAIYVPSSTTSTVRLAAGGSDAVTTAVADKDAWVAATVYYTGRATADDAIFVIGDTTGDVFYVDSVMVTEAPFDGDYFDGSTVGGAWTGAVDASKSTYGSSTVAASYALWELATAGFEFARAWWAKGRLWAVDGSGRWYMLAGTGGTIENTDAFWASGISEGGWSLAEAPSAVYLGNGRTIYTVRLDADGTVPELAVPSVAAALPAGESISALTYYLGHLVIATNRGVRIAVTDESGVAFGPLVVRGDFSQCNDIGATDSRVFVTGQPEDHDASVVVALDLGQMVADLLPGWAPWQTLNDVASPCGALVDSAGKVFAWAGDLYGGSGDLAESGSLTTGYQRYGTLEPKKFHTVSLRVGGSGGSIEVSRVMADGTEVSLYTLPVAKATGEEITLGLQDPQEMLALKFTLRRDESDPTLGPELLGYQLRALPTPRRQRLIRLPLSLFDVERASSGRTSGRSGDAWARLEALEDMESSGGTFSFRDFRTGEAGECYIEKVEHRGMTPPGRQDSGFGGICFVTLRKL